MRHHSTTHNNKRPNTTAHPPCAKRGQGKTHQNTLSAGRYTDNPQCRTNNRNSVAHTNFRTRQHHCPSHARHTHNRPHATTQPNHSGKHRNSVRRERPAHHQYAKLYAHARRFKTNQQHKERTKFLQNDFNLPVRLTY